MASKKQERRERANYNRYHKLVIDEAGRVLRKLFEVKALAQAPSVEDFLNLANTKTALAKLQPRFLKQDQFDLIYPPSGDEADINTWDITLISLILRNTLNLSQQEDREVIRIRTIRNETCGHVAQTRLSNKNYTRQWAELVDAVKDVLGRIGQQNFETETIDRMNALGQDNDLDYLEAIVDTWRNDDHRFVETQASKKVQQLLQNNTVVTITGVSGSGKSGIAHHAALMLGQQGYMVYPVTEADDILKYRDPCDKQVFVFDDPIGKHVLELNKQEQFQKYHEYFKTFISGDSFGMQGDDQLNYIQTAGNSHVEEDTKIIIACRKNILKDKNFTEETIVGMKSVHLNEKETMLTTEEKRAMFSKYAPLSQVSYEDIDDIVQNNYDNFPILCKIFGTKFHKYEGRAKEFFKKPFECLKTEIANLKRGNPNQFCSLLLCLVFENSFDIKCLQPSPASSQTSKEKETIGKLMYMCGTEGKGIEVERSFRSLVGIYFIQEGSRFRFIHDTMVDAVGHEFGKEFPAEMIEMCALSFIREYVRTEGVESEHVIRVPKREYGTLAKRFCSDLKDGNFHDVFRNPSFSDTEFLDVFCNYIKNMGKDYVRQLFFETPLRSESLSENHGALKSNIRNNKEQFTHALLQQTNGKGIHYVMAYNLSKIFDACHSVMGRLTSRTKDDLNFILMAFFSSNITILDSILNDNKTVNIADVGRYYSAVHMAAASGDIDMVETVISKGNDANVTKASTYTPLHIAAAHGYVQIVKKLIEHKANVHKCTKTGESPLFTAAYNGHTEVVSVLLQNHADVDICIETESSPQCEAAYTDHTEVSVFIHNQAEVDKHDRDGRTPLFVAAQNGHAEVVTVLLQNHADINKCRNGKLSPLYIASQNGHTEVVSTLLQNHADVDKYPEDGSSPLWIAVYNGHTDVVSLLLQNHADVNKCRYGGYSPLWIASQNGHKEVVSALLQNHADVNKCSYTGSSPLWKASQNGHTEVVFILLQNDADVNKCNKAGDSPLWIASQNGHTEVASLLLQNHADVDKCSNHTFFGRRTPLYIASQNGNKEVVSVLLQNHADVNKNGVSPLLIARLKGHSDIEAMLLEHDAHVDMRYRLSANRCIRWYLKLSRNKRLLLFVLVFLLFMSTLGFLFLLLELGLLDSLVVSGLMIGLLLLAMGIGVIVWILGHYRLLVLLVFLGLMVVLVFCFVLILILSATYSMNA